MSFLDEVVVEYAMWCICFRGLVCALLWSYSVWKIVQCLIFHIFYCLIYSSKLSYMLIWEGPLIDTYLEWNDAPCLRFLNSPISLILHSSIYVNDCRFLCQKVMCTLDDQLVRLGSCQNLKWQLYYILLFMNHMESLFSYAINGEVSQTSLDSEGYV